MIPPLVLKPIRLSEAENGDSESVDALPAELSDPIDNNDPPSHGESP